MLERSDTMLAAKNGCLDLQEEVDAQRQMHMTLSIPLPERAKTEAELKHMHHVQKTYRF